MYITPCELAIRNGYFDWRLEASSVSPEARGLLRTSRRLATLCPQLDEQDTPRRGRQGTTIPLHPPRTFLPLAAVSQLTTSSGPGPTGQGGGGRGGGTRPARRGRLTKLKMGSRFFDELIKGRRLPVCVRLRVTLIRACCNIPTPRFGGALPWYAGGPFISRMPSGMELRAAQRLLTRITGRTADEIQHGGE